MQVIKASQFKQQCLALLDRLDADGLLITKRGKPVARLVPADADCAGLIGCLKGKIEIRGDLFSTGLNWDAQS
jgi:prevent-host-death family protein